MDLIEATCAAIAEPEPSAIQMAAAHQQRLTKPPGSLGRLEDLSIWLAGVRGTATPRVVQPVVVVVAADHGVSVAGVSAYPREVTGQMLRNFLSGGAAINVLGRVAGARVVIVDAGVLEPPAAHAALISLRGGAGTFDIRFGPAMDRATARRLVEGGITLASTLIAGGADAIALGDMGIGNTTASAVLVAAVSGLPPAAVTGSGTGVSAEGLRQKVEVVSQALAVNRPDPADGLHLLSAAGGFEHAVLAGVTLGAAAARVPVVLDGFITTAAALVARALCPAVVPYLLASHRSMELAHGTALEVLGLEPLLDLRLRLGEGSGAALALPLLSAAARLLTDMATFDEAGVSDAGELTHNES